MVVPVCHLLPQAESELEALRSELQQQQQELSKRAEALAAAAKEGAAQVRCLLVTNLQPLLAVLNMDGCGSCKGDLMCAPQLVLAPGFCNSCCV